MKYNISHTWDKYVDFYRNGDLTVKEAALVFLTIADESSLDGIMSSMDDFLLRRTYELSKGLYESTGMKIFPPIELNPESIRLIYHWFVDREIHF